MENEKHPFGGKDDPLYDEAVALVRKNRRPSIAMIQRHLRIGWNRASYMLEAMVGTVIDEFGPRAKILPGTKTPNVELTGGALAPSSDRRERG